ncbi:endonuclease/exonuclease/phosphatase family protein [Streptomyces sp. NPDC002490]|uniref:endonuclease/exonuclease/phosphatase family protein n=1 Tax=Streptomyces sp. NPDC002490 TaxID=3154416 RepID=UPI0033257DC4
MTTPTTPARTEDAGPLADDAPPGPGGRRPGRLRARLAGLLLLGVSTVLGFRLADSDGITPVPQLLAFLPWLLAPAALALLLAAFARWRFGMLWGVLALGLVAWYTEPHGKTSEPSGPALAELRVMTSNVEHGGATEALTRAIARERPDLVFVQECDPTCLARLDARLGTDYPHRSAVEEYGAAGSAILSRTPLEATVGLPASTLGMPGAVIEVKGHRIRLQLAHPMPPMPGDLGTWRRELNMLHGAATAPIGGVDFGPMIMAGDFNATQDHAAFRRLLDTGLRDAAHLADASRTATWPASTAPLFGAHIDHVLVSRDFHAQAARSLDLGDTDHRTVVVDLTLHEVARR